jgi:poly(3-hydroxybutyrate) depolymerase
VKLRFFAAAPVAAAVAVMAGCGPVNTIAPTYRLHYDSNVTSARPLVVVLGASGRTLAQMYAEQSQDTYADQHGYVVAYVQAPGTDHNWNAGPDCCAFQNLTRDDVGYLVGQVNLVKARVSIDPHRVYVEGWSNGGFMAARALTARPDVFAAGGEIEAVLDVAPASQTPVRLRHLHSISDTVVPIRGGNSPLLASSAGHPVNIPNSYAEGNRLPAGSVWRLTTTPGTGAGGHGYWPTATNDFWIFISPYRR